MFHKLARLLAAASAVMALAIPAHASFELKDPAKVAVIIFSQSNDGGWAQSIHEARQRMETDLGISITQVENVPENATAIIPAEVDTPILDGRPAVPDAEARRTMMQPEDVAACIHLAATLPERTVVEEIVVAPTIPRDMSAEMEVAKRTGAPE